MLGTLGRFISALPFPSVLTSPAAPLPFRRPSRVADRFSLSVFVRDELVGFCWAILLGPSGGFEGFEDEDEECRLWREKLCNGIGPTDAADVRLVIDVEIATGRPERVTRHKQDENI